MSTNNICFPGIIRKKYFLDTLENIWENSDIIFFFFAPFQIGNSNKYPSHLAC